MTNPFESGDKPQPPRGERTDHLEGARREIERDQRAAQRVTGDAGVGEELELAGANELDEEYQQVCANLRDRRDSLSLASLHDGSLMDQIVNGGPEQQQAAFTYLQGTISGLNELIAEHRRLMGLPAQGDERQV